jgi:hypothetical protein
VSQLSLVLVPSLSWQVGTCFDIGNSENGAFPFRGTYLDGFDDEVQPLKILLNIRGKPTLVTDVGRVETCRNVFSPQLFPVFVPSLSW